MNTENDKNKLTSEEHRVLREEGTEPPWSSALNDEKGSGTFFCVGCGAPLFDSTMKYDSGSGWPSFFACIEDAFDTQTDYKLDAPRTEYHCAKCGGHHGHLFDDGPEPTHLRYCNNGIGLRFIEKVK
ncbi:MAG: peptide-methionine (R)-S-oxide reductase MsrB [Chromatiales bacterium]|nr:peptide-methionine (R)-S-oxide reductase MsrB [Chromatiales bacterium]